MVDQFCQDISVMLKTEFTEGMSAAVPPADDCPVSGVVALPVFRVSGIAVIHPVRSTSLTSLVLTVMLFAEVMAGDSPVRASWMMTGTCWFPGHGFLPEFEAQIKNSAHGGVHELIYLMAGSFRFRFFGVAVRQGVSDV